ncbi:hypothetical protein AAER91_30965, partial [Klebsiella pneumoniae]
LLFVSWARSCEEETACTRRENGPNRYLADKVGVMGVMQQKPGLAQA